jgi:hypothetical protein
MIKRLVNRFTSLIQVKMSISWHWSLNWLAIIHLEFLENILYILFLIDEYLFLQLLDLKTKEEVELTDHGHLEFPSHHFSKFFAKSGVS